MADQGAPAQYRLGPGGGEHAAHLLAVPHGQLTRVVRQRDTQGDGRQGHGGRGDPVHHPPARHLRDDPGERPGEQDADQQAAHQRPDHPAALVVGSQRGGIRHQHLHDDRGHADDHRQRAEYGEIRRDRAGGQGQRVHGEQGGQQRPPPGDVADRHDQQQAGRVPDLSRRDQQGRGRLGHVQRGADRVQQWLRVVEIGHRHRAGDGHEPEQARG